MFDSHEVLYSVINSAAAVLPTDISNRCVYIIGSSCSWFVVTFVTLQFLSVISWRCPFNATFNSIFVKIYEIINYVICL